MSNEDIEIFIHLLDEQSKEMCVFPEKQTFDCCDCTICRIDYFGKLRYELSKE